jgi:hypothetical protein
LEIEGDGADGSDVVGDVVAGGSVAAGGGVFEFAVAVEEGDGDAVDFGFYGDGDVGAAEVFAEAFVEGDEVVLGAGGVLGGDGFGGELEDVVDAEHGDGVGDFLEAVDGFAADAEGGGVGVVELGVLFFEGFEFAEEGVVFGVGDFGCGLGVVEAVVAIEFGAEVADSGFRGRCGFRGGEGKQVVVIGHGVSFRERAGISSGDAGNAAGGNFGEIGVASGVVKV